VRQRTPELRAISPEATPEEVAAVVAAISVLSSNAPPADEHVDLHRLDGWVQVSRLSAHRAGLQRGSWRLYGRIGRRARA
jgi:hypothetical protein